MYKIRKIVVFLVVFAMVGALLGTSIAAGASEEEKIEITPGLMSGWFKQEKLDSTLRELLSTDMVHTWFWARTYGIALFLFTHPDVKLDLDKAWTFGDTSDKTLLLTALAAGEAPAMYFMGRFSGDPQGEIAQGFYADITDLVDQWKLKDYLAENRWALWKPAWVKGRVYGVPRWNFSTAGVMYRKAYFEEAGIFDAEGKPAPPSDWTWNDFEVISKKVRNPKKEIWAATLMPYWREFLFNSFGLPRVIPDTTGTYTWKSSLSIPEMMPLLEFVRGVAESGDFLTPPVGDRTQWHIGWADFQNTGRAAMCITSNTGGGFGRAIGSSDYLYGPSYNHPAKVPEDISFGEAMGIAPIPKGPQGVRIANMESVLWGFNPQLSEEELKAAFEFYTFNLEYTLPLCFKAWSLTAGQTELNITNAVLTVPLPGVDSVVTLVPEWGDVLNQMVKFPVKPSPGEYNMPVDLGDSYDALFGLIMQNPKVDLAKEAKTAANLVNQGVLDYKMEGQTVKDYQEYYQALDKFYKENFPDYYQEVFSDLFEKYYKVW